MSHTRLRQLVFASHKRDDISMLKEVLDLGAPYEDPGVGYFGLVNGVFAVGDQFLEVVVPNKPDTAAGRFLDRNKGEGGYMAIFEVPDIAATRARADALELRRVWNTDLPEISASHVHPADIGAAIVSFDQPKPAGAWLWGGPDWKQQSVPGRLAGATLSAQDPEALARRWATLLDSEATARKGAWEIALDGGRLTVAPGDADRLTGFDVRLADPDAVLARAQDKGLAVESDTIRLMGVAVRVASD